MQKILRFAILPVLFFTFFTAGKAFASGGTCPANSPVQGSNCYFIAASGSDTNNGTSESTPWLHAPGMPACTGNCAAVTPSGGMGFIFRGGDTWHFGNSGASPYTGGTWNFTWSGTSAATCMYEGNQTGCIYIGIDPAWYSGSSWARPVLNGDNPLSTSLVSSCAYQSGGANQMVNVSGSPYQLWDSFEFTGLCSSDTTNVGNAGNDVMFLNNGCGSPPTCSMMTLINNFYMHGWTVSTATQSNGALQCYVFGGGALASYTGVVVDGSDSDPGVCAWGIFPDIHHMKDSIFRYVTQGVANWCHDIHDNIFEHFYSPYVPTHGNALECNVDASGNAQGQPSGTPNVYYNNIMRHFDPSMGLDGQVDLWLCPTATPEYWFNNLSYDLNPNADQGSWDIAGPPTYTGCPNSGHQYMFNNTLVDTIQPCYLGPNNTGGQYLTIYNEHLINSPYDSSGNGGCTGGPGSPNGTNVAISDATATSQGYTSGSSGTSFSNTCANEGTTPCAPTASGNSSVGAGANQQAYCTTLASYTSEPAIGFEAANACKNGTSDSCSYNTTTHTMNCPNQNVVSRPASAAWDSGAYQYFGLGAPTNLRGTVP